MIDLPVAREKATNIPYLPGSSLKGVLRDACDDAQTREDVFGPDTTSGELTSSVAFTDLRLVLLPVRSVSGTLAWITAPYILLRFMRDLMLWNASPVSTIPELNNLDEAAVIPEGSGITHNGQVLVEDLDLRARGLDEVAKWAEWLGKQVFPDDPKWQEFLAEHICLVHDDVFGFLVNTATEVFARIRLQRESKTVEKGGLWYEEALPAETILSGIILASPVRSTPEQVFAVLEKLTEKPLQLGGNTVGSGLCRVILRRGAIVQTRDQKYARRFTGR